jgi:hypothetical protein
VGSGGVVNRGTLVVRGSVFATGDVDNCGDLFFAEGVIVAPRVWNGTPLRPAEIGDISLLSLPGPGALLKPAGTIIGDLYNYQGTIDLNSAQSSTLCWARGRLDVQGGYIQSENGSLSVGLEYRQTGPVTWAATSDVLAATHDAELEGLLVVVLAGPAPPPSAVFTPLTAARGYKGDFAQPIRYVPEQKRFDYEQHAYKWNSLHYGNLWRCARFVRS